MESSDTIGFLIEAFPKQRRGIAHVPWPRDKCPNGLLNRRSACTHMQTPLNSHVISCALGNISCAAVRSHALTCARMRSHDTLRVYVVVKERIRKVHE